MKKHEFKRRYQETVEGIVGEISPELLGEGVIDYIMRDLWLQHKEKGKVMRGGVLVHGSMGLTRSFKQVRNLDC